MVNYSGDVNVHANEVNGWERLPTDMDPSLSPFLLTSCFLIDPVSHEPDVLFNSPFDEGMFTTSAEQSNTYASSKIRTAG